jgi:hypothetical protein
VRRWLGGDQIGHVRRGRFGFVPFVATVSVRKTRNPMLTYQLVPLAAQSSVRDEFGASVSARRPIHGLGALQAIRLLRQFMRVGFLISLTAFFVLGCTVLIDQWIAGQVSVTFMLGTALLLAGLCTGLFAAVAAMGLALSMFFDGHDAGTENQMPIPQQRSDSEPSRNDARPVVEM